MNAAALWIYFPLFFGAFLLLFSEHRKLTGIAGISLCFLLMVIALNVPVNSLIVIGKTSIVFTSSSTLLGRTLELTRSEQTLAAFFYFSACLWCAGSFFVPVHNSFVPIAIMDTALIVAVMAVDPFIYGAFCVILAVLISLPLIWESRRGSGEILFRFLIYQILGMILLALGGWLATSVDINPQDDYLLKRTVVLLFCGSAFWLAAFPFFNWIALMMDAFCPFVIGFIISLLQFSAMFILLRFLNDHIWMRTYEPLFYLLRLSGVLMLLMGAVWASFQHNLQRLLAYMIIAENGVSLLLLGAQNNSSVRVFLIYLFIHLLSILIWSMAVKILSADSGLDFDSLHGILYRKPTLSAAIILSHFMMTGMPLMAGFPLRMSLITNCFEKETNLGWACAIGCGVLLFTGFRLLYSFTEKTDRKPDEPLRIRIVMIVGSVILLLLGLFPNVFGVFMNGIQAQYAVIFGG